MESIFTGLLFSKISSKNYDLSSHIETGTWPLAGADTGEVKWVNFHPLFLSPLLTFFSYPSTIEIIFDFSDFPD